MHAGRAPCERASGGDGCAGLERWSARTQLTRSHSCARRRPPQTVSSNLVSMMAHMGKMGQRPEAAAKVGKAE